MFKTQNLEDECLIISNNTNIFVCIKITTQGSPKCSGLTFLEKSYPYLRPQIFMKIRSLITMQRVQNIPEICNISSIFCAVALSGCGYAGLTSNQSYASGLSPTVQDSSRRMIQRYNLDGNLEEIAPTTDFTCTRCH